ncbi:MAG: tryptophan--tRNA ligase [Candidatus Hodarchaeaceae archaeon]|nr:tryptophan--tRNA ligase [Candidatus Hodarchaeaceae archaeon]
MPRFVVTPWEVKGKVDYDKLVKQFGTKLIDHALLKRLEKHAGKLHMFLERGIFFSHRDFDWILNKYEEGEKFFLYTGRGPSGHTHVGHLIPWIFTKYLQDAFDAELYFQMTDDEKFLFRRDLDLDDAIGFTYENALDVIACGFDPKKTFIFSDVEYAKTLYKTAIQVAKHTTFSTVKAVFGFKGSSNIGIIFFPAMQAAPCFFPSVLKGKNIPCLIPAAIDQDPYWRPSRDVAPKLGFYKPAQLHCKFIPGLGKGGKMSASQPETCIFTTDAPEAAAKKIMNAFTGGRGTVKEQREKGGNPDICSVYQYFYFLFEESDKKLGEIYRTCKNGELICGDCKKMLAEKVKKFLVDHQRKREKAKNVIQEFMLKD